MSQHAIKRPLYGSENVALLFLAGGFFVCAFFSAEFGEHAPKSASSKRDDSLFVEDTHVHSHRGRWRETQAE